MTPRRTPGRKAHTTTCPRCFKIVIRGLDEDRAALTATIDPTPLDRVGETLALLAGRPTYTHDTHGQLWHRDRWRITGTPRPGDTTHAEHQCPEEKTGNHHPTA